MPKPGEKPFMNAHHRSLRIVFMAIAIAMCMPFISVTSQAQDVSTDTDETAATSQAARFSLHPVDNPEVGFIDDVPVAQGESVTLEFLVRNSSPDPVELRIYKTNAGNASNGGFRSGTIQEEPVGVTQWIGFETQEFTLQGSEERVFSFTVSVPADAQPGQYITALVAETADPMPIPGSTALDQRIRYAMSVGILVPGDLHHSFELGEPTLENHRLIIPITNTGNYLVRPAGEIGLVNESGTEVLASPMELGSVYAGNATEVVVTLPEQLASGDYVLTLSLQDAESGASALIDGVSIFVPEPEDPRGLSLGDYAFTPNADPIVLLDVSVTIANGGQQLPAANVVLEVSRDGEVTEEYAMATNQVLLNGDNQINARYIPADGTWESGTYTFKIIVNSVNPSDGQEIELLNQSLDGEIIVP